MAVKPVMEKPRNRGSVSIYQVAGTESALRVVHRNETEQSNALKHVGGASKQQIIVRYIGVQLE